MLPDVKFILKVI